MSKHKRNGRIVTPPIVESESDSEYESADDFPSLAAAGSKGGHVKRMDILKKAEDPDTCSEFGGFTSEELGLPKSASSSPAQSASDGDEGGASGQKESADEESSEEESSDEESSEESDEGEDNASGKKESSDEESSEESDEEGDNASSKKESSEEDSSEEDSSEESDEQRDNVSGKKESSEEDSSEESDEEGDNVSGKKESSEEDSSEESDEDNASVKKESSGEDSTDEESSEESDTNKGDASAKKKSADEESTDESDSDDSSEDGGESEDEIKVVLVGEAPRGARKRVKHDNTMSKRPKVDPSPVPVDITPEVSKVELSLASSVGASIPDANSESSILVDEQSGTILGEESGALVARKTEPESPEESEAEEFEKNEVVVIDSESEVDESLHSSGPRSAVHLLKSLSEHVTSEHTKGINTDAVSMHDLVGSPDLTETYQFNFSVDVEYFLTFLHSDFPKKGKICFITGSPVLLSHPLRKLFEEKFNISEAIAPLPHRYASHHSKMMINFFGQEAEIVIMTSNLTQLDFGGLSQSVWRSGRLKKGPTKTTSGKRFRFDLLRYLSRYGITTTKLLIPKIEKLDFSSVQVELVASAPGTFDMETTEKSEAYGFAKLRQALERNNLLISDTKRQHKLLSQVTSIASPYICQKGQTSSVFTHLLCPLMFSDWKTVLPGENPSLDHQEQFNYEPQLVFPRTKDIAESSFGYLSGSAVHFNYTGPAQEKQYEQNIKNHLFKWKSGVNVTGRENLTPHSKYYLCDNGDNWRSIRWALVGSHNLSKQAWGYPVQLKKGTYEVSSYELSVLIPGPLTPSYKSDFQGSAPFRLPFSLPPQKYGSGDVPWSNTADCGSRKDRYGNTYRGM